ncbi:MAG TPA: hypothetical protein DF427_09705 [Moraxellaceae bacterium]|nr:hypothetical protein [Moraxellaceae bacterium]
MVGTTSTKKELIDFLWDWADSHGDWSKLLVEKVVFSESPLPHEDRELVFNYFLQALSLHSGLPSINIQKPAFSPAQKRVELVSLSDVSGVNRLADGQTIKFGENLTIIYGENGTGKTGYGRILKSLGFSYDVKNVVHPNIYSAPSAKSAMIKFKANSDPDEFQWNGNNKNPDLESISVFNNNCVQISLNDRHLIVSPMGFHLFGLIISELSALEKMLDAKLGAYKISLDWRTSLHAETPQEKFISSLSGSSLIATLNSISTFTLEQEIALFDKEAELASLNKATLQAEKSSLDLQINEINGIKKKIDSISALFSDENIGAFSGYLKEIADLESISRKGLKEVAEGNGIKFYETKEFQDFILAAENYVRLLDKPGYPEVDDVCVYCRQPIDEASGALLSSYRVVLNDKTQENISGLRNLKDNFIKKVRQLDVSLQLHQPCFGLDEAKKPMQPKWLAQYHQDINKLKSILVGEVEGDAFVVDHESVIKLINEKVEELNSSIGKNQTKLADIDKAFSALTSEINELKDRKLLSTKISEVTECIKELKSHSTLSKNRGKFNSKAISTKTTQAREELVRQNFNERFQEELKHLRKSHIPIDLNFGTSKGNSQVIQSINSHALTEILSEGEQKAIALAEFLTELQLDNIRAPVIFDDPVNSLDHHIIDDVARRLLGLSRERQVVIFTHSVLLFNSLLYFSKTPSWKDVGSTFYNTRNEFESTGVIALAEEEINKPKACISKINALLNNSPKDQSEEKIAKEGYALLRSAIELCVEHEILQGSVKRYQKNIALSEFVKIDGEKINDIKGRLNEIFERCCGFISAHSHPVEVANTPTVIELRSDFEDFKTIRGYFVT